MTVVLTRMVVVSTLVCVAPGGLRAEDLVKPHTPGAKTIVVIGASYAGGWDPGGPIAGYRIVAKGVSGEQSSDVLARFEADVLALKPDAVIIWGFINDIFRGDRSRMDDILKGTRKNLQEMAARARNAGIVPILATEVTIRGKDSWSERGAAMIGWVLGKESYQDYINRHVRDVNQWIRETAEKEGLILLDFEMALADRQGIRKKEFTQPDGSHISSKGYERLRRFAEDRLTSAFSAR